MCFCERRCLNSPRVQFLVPSELFLHTPLISDLQDLQVLKGASGHWVGFWKASQGAGLQRWPRAFGAACGHLHRLNIELFEATEELQ